MPAVFASGDVTRKYDKTVPADLINEFDQMNARMNDTYESITSFNDIIVESVEHYGADIVILQERCDDMTRMLQKLQQDTNEKMKNLCNSYDTLYRVIYRILNSRFMRFLNHFGKWYTISKDVKDLWNNTAIVLYEKESKSDS